MPGQSLERCMCEELKLGEDGKVISKLPQSPAVQGFSAQWNKDEDRPETDPARGTSPAWSQSALTPGAPVLCQTQDGKKKTAGFLREPHTTWTVCPTWLPSLRNHYVLLMVERKNRELTAADEVRQVTFKHHHHADTHAQTSRWGMLHVGRNSPVATAQ